MRRQRDIDGNITYFDENNQFGRGWVTDMASNIFSKITSDTSKKLAGVAAEKIVSKSSEKIGEKIGEKFVKKIEGKEKKKEKISSNDKNKKANITTELAGDKIVKLLREYNKEQIKPINISNTKNKYSDISEKFDELL